MQGLRPGRAAAWLRRCGGRLPRQGTGSPQCGEVWAAAPAVRLFASAPPQLLRACPAPPTFLPAEAGGGSFLSKVPSSAGRAAGSRPAPCRPRPAASAVEAGAGPGSRPRARGWGASPRWGVTPAVRALPPCAAVVGSQSATGGPGAQERACGAGTAPGLRRRRGVGSAGRNPRAWERAQRSPSG